MDLFLLTFAALFSVINPLGTVPIFLGLTQDETKESKNKTALWASVNVFIILVVSFFIGKVILNFFGISIDVLRIAGGIVICSSGFGLLSGTFSKRRGVNKKVANDAQHRSDIALTPLAIPMMAGPGSMSLLIAMYQDYPDVKNKLIILAAILAVAITAFLVLRSASYISRILGASGIVAISRIIGFLVLAIGIQYIINSLLVLFKI
ncbi:MULTISPECIES: MarC family NAAT transporter [unclassified Flavobacterium]|uniref:MarC family NAAT transporter n=1 Tax=unclassified Flavobacterium TaxID=196869 RepID=UPI0013D4F767|nr:MULTISPECIES: MarC family NAAT transporter [unclassified Flavobacterium]MBA5792376.1 MarC family NAAT transporter [Flavobacterium sp. xlx-221]